MSAVSAVPGPSIRVEIVDETGAAGEVPGGIESWIRTALAAANVPDRPLDVAVVLVDQAAMQALNRDFRGKDKPTNVLSFPGGEVAGLPDGEPMAYGDVVICPAVLAVEAREQDKKLEDHWAHLCIHGALHLAGYDHVDPAEAAAMEALETELLEGVGVPNPYEVQ